MKKLILGTALLATPLIAFAQIGDGYGGQHMGDFGGHMGSFGEHMGSFGGYMGGFGGSHILFGLLIMGLLAWLLLSLWRKPGSGNAGRHYHEGDVLTIVQGRFARGEISKEEMDDLLSHLK